MEVEKKYSWYHTTWGIILIALAVFVLAALVVFLLLAIQFWMEIKKGNGEALRQKFYSQEKTTQNSLNLKRSKLEDSTSPFLGPISAPITIVEFADFKCSVCKTTYPIMHKINTNFKDKVKIIFRNFPIESAHPGANKLAQLGVCANEQDKFWEIHDYLFTNQSELPTTIDNSYLLNVGEKLGLDVKKLTLCIDNNKTVSKVNDDFSLGSSLGLQGTPTFFINGEMVEGEVPWETWKKFFEQYN